MKVFCIINPDDHQGRMTMVNHFSIIGLDYTMVHPPDFGKEDMIELDDEAFYLKYHRRPKKDEIADFQVNLKCLELSIPHINKGPVLIVRAGFNFYPTYTSGILKKLKDVPENDVILISKEASPGFNAKSEDRTGSVRLASCIALSGAYSPSFEGCKYLLDSNPEMGMLWSDAFDHCCRNKDRKFYLLKKPLGFFQEKPISQLTP